MIRLLSVDCMIRKAKSIYKLHVSGREEEIKLELHVEDDNALHFQRPLEPGELDIIETGIMIIKLLIKLRLEFPNHPTLVKITDRKCIEQRKRSIF